ncbi:hypothetical protein G3M58_66375, partial [Streptomyces sp. SID7499]|nr:hypothetical protein [Streptomyces sp. SID7499]
AYLAGEEYAADRAFWSARTAGSSVTAPHRSPALPDAGPLHRTTDLPAGALERLSGAARAAKATWAELVVAATAGHLHRLTGS